MTDPDDVFEYLDQAVTNFDINRLLKWLTHIGGSGNQKTFAVEVFSSPLIYACMFRMEYNFLQYSLTCLSRVRCWMLMRLPHNVATSHPKVAGQRTRHTTSEGNRTTVVTHWFTCFCERFQGTFCEYCIGIPSVYLYGERWSHQKCECL